MAPEHQKQQETILERVGIILENYFSGKEQGTIKPTEASLFFFPSTLFSFHKYILSKTDTAYDYSRSPKTFFSLRNKSQK